MPPGGCGRPFAYPRYVVKGTVGELYILESIEGLGNRCERSTALPVLMIKRLEADLIVEAIMVFYSTAGAPRVIGDQGRT